MKILIAGSGVNALLLAKYIKTQNAKQDIYVTTDEISEDATYTPTGIKENDIVAIRDFVKYNQIEFTVVTSGLPIINGIADEFEKEGFPVIAPFAEAARATFFNSIAKKVMYKLKINTPRFGIFDRENIATEHIRKAKFPIVIMNDFTLAERNYNVYSGYKKARIALQQIFENTNDKIVIERYIDSTPIYIYFLTDGVNAVPLITLEKQKGENFMKITALSETVTNKLMTNILQCAVFPFLNDIVKYAGLYSGILGLKIKIENNNFYVLEYFNEFQDYDLQAFLSLFNEDLVQLLIQTSQNLIRKRRNVELTGLSSYTLAIKKSAISSDNEDEDFFITEDNDNVIITGTAPTMNYAKQKVEEYLETICNKKIFDEIINSTKEVLRVRKKHENF